MNIDVREYLRINPISVHELTLSGDGKDCFLYFPAKTNNDGYMVFTQDTMFWSLYKSIFQNLIYGDEENFRLNYEVVSLDKITGGITISWSNSVHLVDSQFTNYVRKHKCSVGQTMPYWSAIGGCETTTSSQDPDTMPFKEGIEKKIKTLESEIDNKIRELRRQAKLNYPGAVVLQSKETKISTQSGNYHVYNNFVYDTGQIWCYQTGLDIPSGRDSIELGSQPLKHNHKNTRAEAMTASFSANRGGGKTLGKFTIGNKDMVSQDSTYGLVVGTNLGVIPGPAQSNSDGSLTFPLYGQNVIDFRNRKRAHNNIPPSANIHIKHMNYVATREVMKSRAVAPDEETWNAAEIQYQSLRVPDLDEFQDEDLTSHDYLLRMTLDGIADGDVKIMKQGVQMLLDIFAGDAFKRLSKILGEDTDHDGVVTSLDEGSVPVTMEQILKPKLDQELVPKGEFMFWYCQQLDALDRIYAKIELIRDMLNSMKPMNYTGRIIISATDDTEQKVIQHYGGKRWRRIENFLRGVNGGTIEERDFGKKLGEEYVCLRESNIPLHTHGSSLNGVASTGNAQWLEKQRGGQTTKMVNFQTSEATDLAHGVKNVSSNYQISPLEYQVKSKLTIPHDNMPPYKEMYIWECVESTKDERGISDEPELPYFKVVWDPNGGLVNGTNFAFSYVKKNASNNQTIGSLKTATYSGHNFIGWYDEDGNAVTSSTVVTKHMTITAQWSVNNCVITFNANGGYFPNRPETSFTRTYKYGQKLGGLPLVEHTQDYEWGDETTFEAWYDDPTAGNKVTSDTTVTGNKTYYAHFNRVLYYNKIGGVTVENEIASGFDTGKYLETVKSLNFNNTFEIVVCAKTGADVFSNQEVFGAKGTLEFGVIGNASNQGVFMWEVLTPGVVNANSMGSVCQPNTTYWWKLRREGNQCTCYVSVNGTTWNVDKGPATVNVNSNGPIKFGVDEDRCNTGGTETFEGHIYKRSEPWLGTIDMSRSYINIFGYRYSFKLNNKAIVTFDAQGGTSSIDSRMVELGMMLGDLPTATKTGCAFINWYTAATGGEVVTRTTTITGNVTFYAHWNAMKYTVTFDKRGGTGGTSSAQVTYGQTPAAISVPTRQGYTFGGYFNTVIPSQGVQWYVSNGNGARPWALATNATLYAAWTAKTYKLFVDPNGGTYRGQTTAKQISPESGGENRWLTTGIDYFQGIGDGADGASRSGYTLLGYYDGRSDGNKVYDVHGRAVSGTYWDRNYSTTDPKPKFKGLAGSADSLTVYAHWQGTPYTITFVPQNGGANIQKTIVYGEQLGLNIPTVSYTGKFLRGWYTASSGGSQVTSSTTVSGNATYYAQWRDANNYTIRFYHNNGTAGVTSVTAVEGHQIGEYFPTSITWTGKQISGWFTSAAGGTQVNKTVVVSGNRDLYAHWQAATYTIALHTNYQRTDIWPHIDTVKFNTTNTKTIGLVADGLKPISVTYGGNYPAIPEPTHPGYSFKNWYDGHRGDGLPEMNFPDGVQPPNPVAITYNTIFWAQWVAKNFTVTWNPVIAGLETTTSIKAYASTVGGSMPTPVSNGRTFDGWFTSSTGGNQVTSQTEIIGNTTFYAHWTAKTYTIHYDTKGHGTLPAGLKSTYTPDDVTYTPPALSEIGYTFLGWSPANIPSNSAGNVTFEASWQHNIYTITFNSAGGSEVAAISGYYNSAVTSPADPTRDGYRFTGWSPAIPSTMPAQNTVCVAQWQLDVITEIVPKSTTYNTDFTAEANGWYNTYQAGSEGFGGAVKWIGSSYTSSWIAFQGGYNINQICSRLYASSNSGKKFFYNPPSGTEKGSRSSGDGGNSDMNGVIVGVGGMGLTKIVAKPGVLIAKIEFSPNASCVCQYSSYSSSNAITVKNSGQYFSAYRAPAGYDRSILSIGSSFEATMYLSDGSTVTADAIATNYGINGWVAQSGTPSLETCTFDFSSKLINKPIGITTNYITFKTNRGSATAINTIVVNGVLVYKHQK